MTGTAQQAPRSGSFATARRGGMTPEEVRRAERMKAMGRGVQTISNILGRPMCDVRALFTPAAEVPQSEPWPFTDCPLAVQTRVRTIAAACGVSLAALNTRNHCQSEVSDARAMIFSRLQREGIDYLDLSLIFDRDRKVVFTAVQRHRARVGQ